MKEQLNFDLRHPQYDVFRQRRRKALDLYEGGERVEGKAVLSPDGKVSWSGERVYLVRHPYETDHQWNIRKCRATYRNFAAPIPDLFTAFINEDRPARELPDALQPVEKDASGLRVNANAFFANVTRLAAAGGTRFVLVDMEPPAGKTVAESKQAMRRGVPYFVSIDPDDVYDWGLDSKGIAWVAIHATYFTRSGFGQDGEYSETITVWTRTGWKRWRRVLGTEGKGESVSGEWSKDSEGEHSLNEVPLVPFHFEPVDMMTGLAAIDDVLSLVVRIFWRDSELDKMLYDRAVPLLVVNGVDQEQWKTFAIASSNALISSDQDGVNAGYAEPHGTSFQALSEAINRDEASVREIALRMIRPPSGVGESADAKRIDQKQLDTQLANFARACTGYEEHCWKLAARWLKLHEGKISAPYRDNYDVDEGASVVIANLLELSSQRIISKAAVLRAEAVQKVLPKDFDVQENTRELASEAKESGTGQSLTELLRGAKGGENAA